MADVGIPYQLVTPLGTLDFNQYTLADHYRLVDVDGMDAAELRPSVHELSQADGARIGSGYRGRIVMSFGGEIKFSTIPQRRVLGDRIAAWLPAIDRADGTLKWTPTGLTERQRTVRLFDGPRSPGRAGTLIKQFQFALVAGDPLAYSITEDTATGANSSATLTAYAVCSNDGLTETWPRIRVNGPFTDLVSVGDVAGGRLINFGAGLSLVAGKYLEIETNPARRKIVDSDGNLRYAKLTVATSIWPWLAPGAAASLRAQATSGMTAASTIQVWWRDAWRS